MLANTCRAVGTLMRCWNRERGGFGGGHGQMGHVATTFAAMCCLKMLGALDEVDTEKLYSFLADMKREDGSFTTTYGGEYDTRSTYCAIASSHIAGILSDELASGTAEYLASCQTYEGGLAAEPDLEAHAGYTYCGLAALALLNRLDAVDIDALYAWALRRLTSQLGFQGRPHKLVDSCYSFWLGAALHIVETYKDERTPCAQDKPKLYEELVSCYILVVAQTQRGFRDKPGKPPDLYHTCYSLSALNLFSPITDSAHNILLNVLEK